MNDDFHTKRLELIEVLKRNEYNLSVLNSNFDSLFIKFKTRHYNERIEKNISEFPRTEHVSSDIEDIIYGLKQSYLSPAYHYNNYVRLIISEISPNAISDYNDELRFCLYQIEAESILISFKIGLDRMIALLTFFYKGLSPEGTTFGHYNSNTNKFDGFMRKVNEGKKDDETLQYIFDQYFLWIKKVVEPRDTIIHFNSLGIHKEYDHSFQAALPIHYNERYFKLLEFDENSEYRFNHASFKDYIDNWFAFFEKILLDIHKKEPIQNPKRIKYPDINLGFE
jgi:hypothetical protein